MEQQYIDPSDLDPALAVDLEAYQKQLTSQAQYFSRISLDFVGACGRASNFAALMNAFAGSQKALIDEAASDPAKRKDLARLLGALADEAGAARLDLAAFDDHLTTLEAGLTRNNASYDATITKAIAQLGEEAQRTGKEIDRLTKAVSDAISAIVEGANETGGAVADLFIGIIAQFTKAGEKVPDVPKPDKPKADAPKADAPKTIPPKVDAPKTDTPKSDAPKADAPKADAPKMETPKTEAPKAGLPKVTDKTEKEASTADFVVKAVKASSNGVAKYSTAIHNLESDNAALAAAYMHLATLSPLVAVATSAKAQKNLFVSAVGQTRVSLKALDDEWAGLRKRLRDTADAALLLDDPDEAKALATIATTAAKMWVNVGKDIGAIRGALTGSGGLPGS